MSPTIGTMKGIFMACHEQNGKSAEAYDMGQGINQNTRVGGPIIYPIIYPRIIWWVVRPWWAGQGANKKWRPGGGGGAIFCWPPGRPTMAGPPTILLLGILLDILLGILLDLLLDLD